MTCPKCNTGGRYFSIYDSIACMTCDEWLEKDHCLNEPEPCRWFKHTTGVKPSEAERSKQDFNYE